MNIVEYIRHQENGKRIMGGFANNSWWFFLLIFTYLCLASVENHPIIFIIVKKCFPWGLPSQMEHTNWSSFLSLFNLLGIYPINHTSSITPTTTKFKSKMAMIIIILTPKKIYGIYPLHYATLCKGSSMFVLYITIITTNTVVIITVIINNIFQWYIFSDKKRLLMELWAEAPPWLSSGTPRSKPTSRCRMSLSPALSPSKSLFSSPYFVITLKIKNYYEAMFEQHQYYILHCQ